MPRRRLAKYNNSHNESVRNFKEKEEREERKRRERDV
jgi:hypothetical protein